MAKKGFSLATPLGVVAVRPEELWNGVAAAASDAANRARAELRNVGLSITNVAERAGSDLVAAQRQNAQVIQALAAQAPRLVARAPAKPPTPAAGASGGPRRPTSVKQAAKPTQQLSSPTNAWSENLMAADAFMRGAADVVSFGKADEIAAGIDAAVATVPDLLFQGKGLQSLDQHYRDELERQQERDRYDEMHRPKARMLGQFAGAAGGLTLGGGLASRAALRMFPNSARIVRNAEPVARLGLDMRGVNTVAAAGGATTGAVDQLGRDFAKGQFSDVNAYAASTLAGVAGGIAGRYSGATGAGAAAGGLTPILQSTAAGRPSLEGAGEAAVLGAIAGAATGHAANTLGKYGASVLPPKWKGRLGEGMSLIKSVARDGKTPQLQVPVKVGSRRTIADQVLEDGAALLEAKFGRWAKLSKAQKAALRQFGPKYIIDHYLPKDVGRLLGVGAGVNAGVAAGQGEVRNPAP